MGFAIFLLLFSIVRNDTAFILEFTMRREADLQCNQVRFANGILLCFSLVCFIGFLCPFVPLFFHCIYLRDKYLYLKERQITAELRID